MKSKKSFWSLPFVGMIIPLTIVALWEGLGHLGKINPSVLPIPSKLVTTLISIIKDGPLSKNIIVSLRRVLSGFALGASCGVLLGISMGLSYKFNRLFLPLTEIIRPIPILAWVPVLILWTGIGEKSKIITIAIGSFWSALLNTTDGVANVDYKYKELANVYVKTKRDTILQVVLPAATPSIFTGLRIGVGSAWLSMIGAEMIAASSGLGYFITYNREVMRPDKMYVGVVVIGIIGWLINVGIRKVEARALRWNSRGNVK